MSWSGIIGEVHSFVKSFSRAGIFDRLTRYGIITPDDLEDRNEQKIESKAQQARLALVCLFCFECSSCCRDGARKCPCIHRRADGAARPDDRAADGIGRGSHPHSGQRADTQRFTGNQLQERRKRTIQSTWTSNTKNRRRGNSHGDDFLIFP